MSTTTYAQQLTDLLPLKIRDAGDPAGLTTAKDHREFETLEIEALAFLESMTRGNRIFVDALSGATPTRTDVLEGDLVLDRSPGLPLWTQLDGQWVALGNLVGADGAKLLGGAGVPSPATGRIGDWYFQYGTAAWEKTATVPYWKSRFSLSTGGTSLPDPTGNGGKVLGTDGTTLSWTTPASGLPAQAGNTGKVLGTDGTAAAWTTPASSLPTQVGNGGRFLTTDGTTASWAVSSVGTLSTLLTTAKTTAVAAINELYTRSNPAFVALAYAASLAIDLQSKWVSNHAVTLTGNATLAMSNVVSGATGTIVVTQDSTGGRTLTAPSNSFPATALPINTTGGSKSVVGWLYDGTTFIWRVSTF